MNYSQKANPNATNSELDAKIIITHKQHDLGEESNNEVGQPVIETGSPKVSV